MGRSHRSCPSPPRPDQSGHQPHDIAAGNAPRGDVCLPPANRISVARFGLVICLKTTVFTARLPSFSSPPPACWRIQSASGPPSGAKPRNLRHRPRGLSFDTFNSEAQKPLALPLRALAMPRPSKPIARQPMPIGKDRSRNSFSEAVTKYGGRPSNFTI